jgi:hypothetical protein
MKKWLSRGIVLAMVIALMIPAPVLAKAKSSKAGGKLVKSVTEYTYNTSNKKWEKTTKTVFTYDKKNNPKTVTTTGYDVWAGIPLSSWSSTETYKYKYKGKTPKSLVVKNEVGLTTETRQYKSGRAAIIIGEDLYTTSKYAGEEWDEYEQEYVPVYTNGVEKRVGARALTYTKSGLVTEDKFSGTTWFNDVSEGTLNGTATYGMNQTKGIPSVIQETFKADGSQIVEPYADQSIFGKKGLVVEDGSIYNNNYTKLYSYEYGVKKGVINKAVVYDEYDFDDNGNRVRTPQKMYEFTYTKTKISKNRYMNMMNSFLNPAAGEFIWY